MIFSTFSRSFSVSEKSDFLLCIITSKSSFLNTLSTSTFAISIPKTSLIFLKEISISLFAKFALSYFAIPPTTSPLAYSANSLQALSIAI